MSIVLVGSTSGSITLQEPAVAGTTVLDLPATSGTLLTTASSVARSQLPSGSVIQTVEATRTSALSYTTVYPTYTSFISGSITTTVPNSKILVLCNVPVYQSGNAVAWSISQYYQMLEGGVLAQQYEHAGAQTGNEFAYQWEFQHLTGAKSIGTYTYSMQGAITGGSCTVTIARNVGGGQTKVSLLMMEIAP